MAKKKHSSPKKATPDSVSANHPPKNDSPSQPDKSKQSSFPIVGIGSSAGGLNALQRLLESMPADPGIALVIIQHLAPDRKSLMPELVSRYTNMEVGQVEDEPIVEANHVYLIPPGKYLRIDKGILKLSDPVKPRGSQMAVDFFFRSLAMDQQEKAVGIILSGTGTDGTRGCKAIKAAGGIVLAQSPSTADQAGMPKNVIDAGIVDHVLAPEEMPKVLVRYANHPFVKNGNRDIRSQAELEPDADADRPEDLKRILALVRAHTKHDFTRYKDSTLVRRTRRRMCLHHLESYSDYLEYLQNHSDEIDSLARDLLISVTDFFRDGDAWNSLSEKVIKPLVTAKSEDDVIRVWVPGCATGEEAYTVAILVLDNLQAIRKTCQVQIFASDIDRQALNFAREGRYPSSIAADVSADQLDKFFVKIRDDDHYRVSKSMRETVVFADQNLLSDPPFSRLDLICCRNVLIYLKPDVQEKLIAMFHFALREGGHLFLGGSETIGRQNDLFETVSKRWRIYHRIGAARHDRLEIPIAPGGSRRQSTISTPTAGQQDEVRLANLAQRQLLRWLAPSSVLVDRHWRILYIFGDVDGYLTHTTGVPREDLLEKCRQGLRSKLRGAAHAALSEQKNVTFSAHVQRADKYVNVTVAVQPIHDPDHEQELLLVVFKDDPETTHPVPPVSQAVSDDMDEQTIIRQLEEELKNTKQDLQSTIEQLEASNEEYKAANEEVTSINEELQSTNEELETSKEEMQSLNEELGTVNNQLASKLEELECKHNDLHNLTEAIHIPTICLDRNLRVRWFTPATSDLVRLTTADYGRPLADFAHVFRQDDLIQSANRVLEKLIPLEQEVECSDERIFLRRVTPYRTDEDRIAGVMITFVDISSQKKYESTIRAAKDLADKIIDTVREGMLVMDNSLRVISANKSFYDHFQVGADETEGKLIYQLGNGQWDIPDLRKLLEDVLPENQVFNDYSVEHEFENIGKRIMVLNARRVDHVQQILLAIEDVTDREMAFRELRQQGEQMRQAAAAAHFGSYTMYFDTNTTYWSPELFVIHGLSPETSITREKIDELIHPDDREGIHKIVREATESPEANEYNSEFRIIRPNGEIRWMSDRGRVVFAQTEDHRPLYATGMVIDITERKQAQEQLQKLNETLEYQVQQRTEMLSILQSITRMANEARTVEEALSLAMARIADYNGWKVSHAWRLMGDGSGRLESTGIWHVTSDANLDPNTWSEFQRESKELQIDPNEGWLGKILTTGKSHWITDIGEIEDWLRPSAITLGLHSVVGFAIPINNEVVAVMEFFTDCARSVEERFLEIMPDVGIQLGRVIERKQLEQEIDAATTNQMRSIGQELHDSVAQELTGTAMVAEVLLKNLNTIGSEHMSLLEKVIDSLRTAQTKVRMLSHGLMPVEVDAEGLMQALRKFMIDNDDIYQCECLFHCNEPVIVKDNQIATHLFRIAQEAFQNAVKHGNPKTIHIELKQEDHQVILCIRDDGSGFSTKQKNAIGSGLRIMKHRASLIGARLDVRSEPGQGVTIICQIGLPDGIV